MTRLQHTLKVRAMPVAAADAAAKRPTTRVIRSLQPSASEPLQLAARADEGVGRRSIEGAHHERADGPAGRRGTVAASRPRLAARGGAAGAGKALECA